MNERRGRHSTGGKARQSQRAPLRFGMHLFDVHGQPLGSVILVRDDHFVMRQELALDQLVAVPMVAVAGIVGSIVFLTLTPGEIELFCHVLERKARTNQGRWSAPLRQSLA